MALAPGTKLDTCEILGSLGAGGMGEVCRARELVLCRKAQNEGLFRDARRENEW